MWHLVSYTGGRGQMGVVNSRFMSTGTVMCPIQYNTFTTKGAELHEHKDSYQQNEPIPNIFRCPMQTPRLWIRVLLRSSNQSMDIVLRPTDSSVLANLCRVNSWIAGRTSEELMRQNWDETDIAVTDRQTDKDCKYTHYIGWTDGQTDCSKVLWHFKQPNRSYIVHEIV